MLAQQFDVVIVGAGPAGCVLAARLSEDPRRRILLLDAGPDYGSTPAAWPADLLDPHHSAVESHSWGYHNAATAGGNRVPLPRARVLGGCSAINACVWLRGSRADYDAWEAAGNPGWGWDDLLPCFMRAESYPFGDPGIHGQAGPVRIARVDEAAMARSHRALFDVAAELGFPYADDLNDSERQYPCYGRTPRNIVAGNRLNGALSYLAAARDRENLTIRPDTLVDRLLLDERAVTGVRTASGQELLGREVVVCSGAYGSPAILLRSGIGPAQHLHDLGIAVAHELPGVGEHLLDHPFVAPYTTGLTLFPLRPGAESGRESFLQVTLKARSRQVDDEIDLIYFLRDHFDAPTGTWHYGLGLSLMYARSRGRVRLTSPDPEAPLDIDHNYFADEADLEALCDGIELTQLLVTTPPLAGLLDIPRAELERLRDRETVKTILREEVGTTFHPSSTCRMGPASDKAAVVDHTCRVHGLDGLRVVDASIFPWGPRCNLHAPVVAVAERAAEIMARDDEA